MLTDPLAGWPSSYSVFARFAAELGIVGLIMWIGLWLGLARAFIKSTLIYQAATDLQPTVVFPLVAGCFCVLLGGFATESLHFPKIWVMLGLGCRYLEDIKMFFGQGLSVRASQGVKESEFN